MRIAFVLFAVVFAVLVVAVALVNARPLPPEELARRCTACEPAWNGYQEDIKEIGARPVAQWQGEPVSISVVGDTIRLEMALSPPWDDWPAAIPILLMDPEGRVVRNTSDEREGTHRIYHFPRGEAADEAPPPWLEVHYPHTRRRVFLSDDGNWHAPVQAND